MERLVHTAFRLFSAIWLTALLLAACQKAEPRIPVVLATFPVEISGPTDIAVNPDTSYVYIINNANQVSVIKDLNEIALLETDSDRSVNNIDMAIDEVRGWVYVVNKYSDSVAVMRDTEVVAVLETAGRQPHEVAIDPQSGWAYVVSPYSRKTSSPGERPTTEGNVTVIIGTEIIGTIPLGEVRATHVVADPVHSYVYVGTVWGTVIVLKGMEEIARYETGSSVNAMDVNSQTGDVYVTGGDQRLYRFKQGKLVDDVKVMEGDGSIGNMQVHPATGDVYLVTWGGFGDTKVVVVRGSRVIASIPVSASSSKMDIDPLSGNVYVADFWNDLVTVVHGTEVAATFETGWYPYGVGVNPANGRVYISNTNEGTITVLGFAE